MKKTLILLGFLALTPFAKGQLLLEVLEGRIPFTPSEKCLERVYDKYYGDGEHNFIYCAVQGPNGKKWLNHNLGAEYTKESSPHFNPEAIPENYNDWRASGSLFQYGRKADGHELVTYYQENDEYWKVDRKFPITTTKVDAINSTNNYVSGNSGWANNLTTLNELSNLWNGTNNPCPQGYRVMSYHDVRALTDGTNIKWTENSKGTTATMSSIYNISYPYLHLFLGASSSQDGENTSVRTNLIEYDGYGESGIWTTYRSEKWLWRNIETSWISGNFIPQANIYRFGRGISIKTNSNNTIWEFSLTGDSNRVNESNPIRCVEQ